MGVVTASQCAALCSRRHRRGSAMANAGACLGAWHRAHPCSPGSLGRRAAPGGLTGVQEATGKSAGEPGTAWLGSAHDAPVPRHLHPEPGDDPGSRPGLDSYAGGPGYRRSPVPEEAGVFSCRDEFEAGSFVRMNNTGGPWMCGR